MPIYRQYKLQNRVSKSKPIQLHEAESRTVEALDRENFVYSYSVIEGDALMNKLEKVTYETKLESFSAGGSICKTTSKYYTIGEFEIKEEGIKAGKEKALGMFKAVEAYLNSNPDAY
ncbi:hypothetical protein CRYUN_Cryun22dG0043500 [Craigia yunnanensis]